MYAAPQSLRMFTRSNPPSMYQGQAQLLLALRGITCVNIPCINASLKSSFKGCYSVNWSSQAEPGTCWKAGKSGKVGNCLTTNGRITKPQPSLPLTSTRDFWLLVKETFLR